MTNRLSRGLSYNYLIAGRDSEECERKIREITDLSMKGKVADPDDYEILSASEVEALLEYSVEKGFHTLYEMLMPLAGTSYPGEHKGYERYRSLTRQFPKVQPDIFDGLEIYPLRYTKLNNYRRMTDMFEGECHDIRTRNQMAYRAFLLFETPEKFDKFVRNTAKSRWKAPRVTSVNQIRFPQKQHWPNVDFRAWGNVYLRFGLKATNSLFLNASPYTTPSREEKSISLRQTWMSLFEVQEYSGMTQEQAGQLVDEVERWSADPKTLTKILDILRERAPEEAPVYMQVPDFELDGEEYGVPGTRFRRMGTDDMRIFFLGKHTDCCEWVGGGYEGYRDTSKDVFQTRMSDFYIIEDEQDGEIVAHTWAWRTEDGGLVFDGFEGFEHQGLDTAMIISVVNQAIERLFEPDMDKYEVTDVYLGKCALRLNEEVKMHFFSNEVVDARQLLRIRIGANGMSSEPSLRKVGYVGRAFDYDPDDYDFEY